MQYGVCVDTGCSPGALLAAIWASMAQAVGRGRQAGFMFEAGSMRPQTGSAAMVRALEVFAELST